MSEPSFLPVPTDLIPAEELSSNLDPPSTLTHAEHLAEALLPGFTVRLWRSEAVSELMPWLSADAGKSKQMVAVPIFLDDIFVVATSAIFYLRMELSYR